MKDFPLRPQEVEGLSHIATRWWGGADPGRETEVRTRLKVPTTRTDEEVVALFAALAEALCGGYPWRISIPKE